MRIAHRGEKRFISLPVKVFLGKWNGDKRRVTGTHPDAGEINAFLSDLERAAFSVISRLERAETPTAAQRITGETQGRA
ncbi:Arm DNA-binding domain-containing protein [Salinibacter ruber]|uniref:Arm DNA-binding domain-containing protein n=1 Tax=Salinibacter ruber TaxID=146919 RepID=UPI00216923EF